MRCHSLSLLSFVTACFFGCATGTTLPAGRGSSSGSGGSSSGEGAAGGAGGEGGSGGAGGEGGSAGGGPVADQSCPPGELIANIDAGGKIVCTTLDALTKSAFDKSCRIHLGARDGCGACVD